MSGSWSLPSEQRARVAATAAILLPGAPDCPAPGDLAELDDLLERAARALGSESAALEQAVARLSDELTWDTLSSYANAEPEAFELLSTVVLGAYFMSPTVHAALGLPTGERRPAPLDQAVDELGTGLLDAVLDRGSPVKTLDEVTGAEVARW